VIFPQGTFTPLVHAHAGRTQGAVVATFVAGTAYAALQPLQSFALCETFALTHVLKGVHLVAG
ncbi:hypothetical protein C7H09_08100, partial [Marinobacter fuscus]